MTADLSTLQIRVLSDDVAKAEKRLRALEKQGGRTAKSTSNATSKFKKYAAGLLAAVVASKALGAAMRGLREVVRVTAEFQQLNAQLVTATGSADNARKAFDALKDFAVQTPFDLQQATGAFIGLVNRGLTPSERALRAYGDTAASMGFQLQDMVLAVSNATANEFENLKKFGIRARKEGENIKFTFRGVTTEVGNNITEIEDYFIGLGENNFSGGMERQMQTLTGAISNFQDSYEILLNAIGESGIGDLIEGGIRRATAALEDFTAWVESGALEAQFESWTAGLEGWSNDFQTVFSFLGDFAGSIFEEMGEDSTLTWEVFIDALKLVPALVRYYVQRIGIEIMAIGAYGGIAGKALYNGLKVYLESMVRASFAAAKQIGAALMNPIDTAKRALSGGALVDFSAAGAEVAKGVAKINGVINTAVGEADAARQNRIAQLGAAQEQLDTAATKIVAARRKSEQLLADFQKKQASSRLEAAAGDRLGGFGIKPSGGGGGGGGGSRKSGGGGRAPRVGGGGGGGKSEAQRAAERRKRDFEKLVESLQDEEVAIAKSYKKRQALIDNNTDTAGKVRADLSLKLIEKVEEEQQRLIDSKKRENDTFFEALADQETLIRESYERRKAFILANTEQTEEEKRAALDDAEKRRTNAMRKHEAERNEMTLGLAGDFFGNLAAVGKAFGKKGAKIAKAAAIAQTTIKTYESATSAYASLAGIPFVGPALGAAAAAAAVAAGAANIAAIKATPDGGNFAFGGIVPGSQVGDNQLIGANGGEMVLTGGMQRELLGLAKGGRTGAGGAVNNVYNYGGGEVTTEQNETGGVDVIIRRAARKGADLAKSELAQEAVDGSGKVFPTLSKFTNLQRGSKTA